MINEIKQKRRNKKEPQNKSKRWFFETVNKIDKILVNLIFKKGWEVGCIESPKTE